MAQAPEGARLGLILAVAVLLAIAGPAYAAPPAPTAAPVVVAAPATGIGDPLAAAEIRHVREMLSLYDRLYTAQFEAQRAAVAAALAAAKDATTKADAASEKRLDSVNEFRGQLKDQAGTFVTRAELWGYLVGGAGLLMSLLMFLRGRNRESGTMPSR